MSSYSKYYKYIIPIIAILVVAGLLLYPKIFKKDQANASASISGTIDFNGVAPEGSTFTLYQRIQGESRFKSAESGIEAQDKAAWDWDDAEKGKMYEIKATLVTGDGDEVDESNVITVAAPATGEVLSINSQEKPETPTAASISGSVGLNGYIPSGTTINVLARPNGTTQFNQIASSLSATDGVTWSWSGADAGTQYDLQAQLMSPNGNVIAQSPISTISAPAANEVLNITSQVTPPGPTTGSISGQIDLNGNIPSNGMSISIGVRPTGTSQFNIVLTNLSAQNGTNWSVPNLNAGTSYDFQAYLQQGTNTVVYSQVFTWTAPAANEVIVINAPSQAAAPPQMTSMQCFGQNGAGLWNGTASYKQVSGAQQYWIQIGTSPQTIGNVFSYRYTPSSSNLSGNIYTLNTGNLFTTGTQYYMSYAYSNSATSTYSGDFSQFSNPFSFTCNAGPTSTNTPTPTPTNTPTPTPTSTPTPTPTNTPTPTPALSPTGLLY